MRRLCYSCLLSCLKGTVIVVVQSECVFVSIICMYVRFLFHYSSQWSSGLNYQLHQSYIIVT